MKQTMSGAWHAGVIAKSTKTPPLAQLLGNEPEVQSAEDMSAALQGWVKATRFLSRDRPTGG